MGSKPRGLGYCAAQRIDAAMMHQMNALHELTALVQQPGGSEERYVRIARAINEIHYAIQQLKEVKSYGVIDELTPING